jgi:predicted nucleotidyltransferase
VNEPRTLPEPHRAFVRGLLESLKRDARIAGVMAGGSYLTDSMDEFSDLDLVIAVDPDHYDAVMADRKAIAASLGHLLAAFTGEHVGEPRLLICLYDAPLLHVDLKFVSMNDVDKRVEDPAVLWERDGRVTEALNRSAAVYPMATPAWIEDRFWIWVHYGATKIARGELFEAIDFLSALRNIVLGPMGLRRACARPQGVRKIEMIAPEFAKDLQRTVAGYDDADCLRALRASVDIYRALRNDQTESEAERAAMKYLSAVEAKHGQQEK